MSGNKKACKHKWQFVENDGLCGHYKCKKCGAKGRESSASIDGWYYTGYSGIKVVREGSWAK